MKQAGKLRRIGTLMLLSQLLLLAFMGYWLYTQYENERTSFQKDLIAQFDESQRKISDSLLGYLMQSPIPVKFKAREILWSDTSLGPQGKQMIRLELNDSMSASHIKLKGESAQTLPPPQGSFTKEEKGIAYNIKQPGHAGVNVSFLIKQLKTLTDSNQDQLFHRDTVLFNKELTEKMKANGWGFVTRWTKDSSSVLRNKKSIYIKSDYFTDTYGLEVSHFSWYLFKKTSPQLLFTIVLLMVTGLSFRLAYRSLKEQMLLGGIKNDFISNMSHELKTPVSTIKVALEALDTYNVIEDKKTAREYIEMANMEIRRLDLLINQALNTALIEEGRMIFHKEPEDLKTLCVEVLEMMKMRFTQQQATINFGYNGLNFYSQADRLHIQGVLINILDNCLKYAQHKPVIDLNVNELDNDIQITIADKGPGIPAAYLDKIFDKFFRVPTGNEHNTKGYGLGLSYAAQVMLQHGGSIKAMNRPGGGCIFTLSFIKDKR